MLAALDRHCRIRSPDGTSAIDPERSHKNCIFYGSDEGLMQSLREFYEGGVQKPTKQAEKPYLRCVASASPEYFRPGDPSAVGTWDEERLEPWIDATMDHIEAQFGDDLVFAELHLDEDTPHIHFVVAPTYQKTARKPGRQRRNETVEEFEARKRAVAERPKIRKVGRASHPELSKINSFQVLRQKMALAVDHLGIEYGTDRSFDAPTGKTTREWVKETAWRLRREQALLKRERLELSQAKLNAETEGFAAGKAVALEAHREALAAATSLIDRQIPCEELSKDAKLTRKVVQRIQSMHLRSAHVSQGHDPRGNWLAGLESYVLRVGDDRWHDALAEVRDAHQKGIEQFGAITNECSLLDRTKAFLRAIVCYWNGVGEAVGRLFRSVRPSSDDEVTGTIERLLPEPLDERALLNELNALADTERRKAELTSALLAPVKP